MSDLATTVMAALSGTGLGAAAFKAIVWLGDKNKREADVADSYTSTGSELVKAVREDYERIREEVAQERLVTQKMRDVASAIRVENDDLRERVRALEIREDRKDRALHELTVWSQQAVHIAANHEPPLHLPPPPRSPLDPTSHLEH